MSSQYQQLEDYVSRIGDKYIHVREHLHQYPELGRQEIKTSEYLRNILHQSGYASFDMVGPTGFVTDLVTNREAPWVALRADMDALAIPDHKDTPYKSVHPGVSHACGHDFHSAVVAGVAETLQHFCEDLKGNIRFIFQHAEEPIPGGAIDFVEQGKLDGIKAVYGFHADPEIKAGHIGLREGWINAQSIQFRFRLQGPGGHSARPHETADPIVSGMQLLNMLYTFFSRKQNPEQPFVFTVGKINGGSAYNSIAQEFECEGTLRVTNERQGDKFLKNMSEIVKNITVFSLLKPNFEYWKGAPPVINDSMLTNQVRNIITQVINSENIHEHPRSMGGEDFSSYLRKAPGVFIRFGIGDGRKKVKLHSSEFDIRREAIPFAIQIYSWILLNIFAQPQE